MGFLNQSEMPAADAAADLPVLPPTRRETWGLVANEALASGVPVVVSDACGCAPDLAGDGSAGPVFPMGDVAAMAKAMNEILDEMPPSLEAIAARSTGHSIGAAAAGIEAALVVVEKTRR